MSKSYPALIELIARLEGKDKRTCELALYCLNRADKRDAKLRAHKEKLEEDNARMMQQISEHAAHSVTLEP